MARNNQAVPTDFSIEVPTKAISSETMAASQIFAKDIAKLSTPVNSIMEPSLYQLYIDDLRY